MSRETVTDDYLCIIGGSPLAEVIAEPENEWVRLGVWSNGTGESTYIDAEQCAKLGEWFTEASKRLGSKK